MRPFLAAVLSLAAAASAAAQQPRALTADDYARAERYLAYNTTLLVAGGPVRPTWLAGDRFWYRNATPEGNEFVLVDPARRSRERAFDHARIAAALSRAADTTFGALSLPFTQFEFADSGRAIAFDARGRRFTCDLAGAQCTGVPQRRRPAPAAAIP